MAAIDFDDLVATMNTSCIGQEAMDLRALHAHLSQTLFMPPAQAHPGQPTPVSSYQQYPYGNLAGPPPSSLTSNASFASNNHHPHNSFSSRPPNVLHHNSFSRGSEQNTGYGSSVGVSVSRNSGLADLDESFAVAAASSSAGGTPSLITPSNQSYYPSPTSPTSSLAEGMDAFASFQFPPPSQSQFHQPNDYSPFATRQTRSQTRRTIEAEAAAAAVAAADTAGSTGQNEPDIDMAD